MMKRLNIANSIFYGLVEFDVQDDVLGTMFGRLEQCDLMNFGQHAVHAPDDKVFVIFDNGEKRAS